MRAAHDAGKPLAIKQSLESRPKSAFREREWHRKAPPWPVVPPRRLTEGRDFTPARAGKLPRHHADFAPPPVGERRGPSATRDLVFEEAGSAFDAAGRTISQRISERFNSLSAENMSRFMGLREGAAGDRKMGPRSSAAPTRWLTEPRIEVGLGVEHSTKFARSRW